jgi:hypothetical protein
MPADHPAIHVDADNDVVFPGRGRATAIAVAGCCFPPGSAVNIKVIVTGKPPLRGNAAVRADGSFEWDAKLRPQLGCNDAVAAVVHGADGITAEGQAAVFCL